MAAAPSKTNRSRITNGSALLAGIDGRTAAARRYRDLVIQFADDLGGGDKLTAAEISLVKAAAGACVQGEQLQARIVRGEPVDPDETVRLSNLVGRLLKALMEKRGKRAAAPDLDAYLAGEDA